MLAVAVIASNQDRNMGAIPGYTEAGGCRIIAKKLCALLTARGCQVLYVEPALESQDKTQHQALYDSFPKAATWLNKQRAEGARTCAVHVHTNAGSTPADGTSHTGFCWSMNVPESRQLGRSIAERVAAVLGLPVVEYQYTNWLYDKLILPHPSTIIEVTRHDRKIDLEALYGRVDAVAAAIADGVLLWGGSTGPADLHDERIRQLTRENGELRSQLLKEQATRRAALDWAKLGLEKMQAAVQMLERGE